MCGRYAFYTAPQELMKRLGLENLINFSARYNCAPMQSLPIVIRNRMGFARWGLQPPWAEPSDQKIAGKMINARSETVHEKASFKNAWHKGRRCLIPANGFFEWKKGPDGVNQPYYISDPAGEVVYFAGLWEKYSEGVSFTILTKQAEGRIADIHHRTPVVIGQDRVQEWFGGNEMRARGLVEQSSSSFLEYYKVSRDVGKVANDDASLIEPLSDRAA